MFTSFARFVVQSFFFPCQPHDTTSPMRNGRSPASYGRTNSARHDCRALTSVPTATSPRGRSTEGERRAVLVWVCGGICCFFVPCLFYIYKLRRPFSIRASHTFVGTEGSRASASRVCVTHPAMMSVTCRVFCMKGDRMGRACHHDRKKGV